MSWSCKEEKFFFSFGCIIEHEVRPITSGVRNVLDLIFHNLTFKRSDDKVKELGKEGFKGHEGRGVRPPTIQRKKRSENSKQKFERNKRKMTNQQLL